MKSSENSFIAILLITAVILGVLVVGSWQNRSAQAATVDRTMTSDYIMVTGNINDSTSLLYVIDVPSGRLIVYGSDTQGRQIQIVDDRINLGRLFNR